MTKDFAINAIIYYFNTEKGEFFNVMNDIDDATGGEWFSALGIPHLFMRDWLGEMQEDLNFRLSADFNHNDSWFYLIGKTAYSTDDASEIMKYIHHDFAEMLLQRAFKDYDYDLLPDFIKEIMQEVDLSNELAS